MSFDFSYEHAKGRFKLALRRDALMLVAGVFLTGGVSAVIAPWWLPLASVVLGYGGVTLEPAFNWLVGLPLILGGFSCLALKVFVVDRRTRALAADKALVTARPPNPGGVMAYFDSLTTHDSYLSSAVSAFQAEYTLYAAPQHRLQESRTRAAFAEFKTSAEQLHLFTAGKFDWFPKMQVGYADHRYCLAPDQNLDRALLAPDAVKEAEYADLKTELDKRVRAAKDTHGAFLERLRELGHI
jgi:hypothetical protein